MKVSSVVDSNNGVNINSATISANGRDMAKINQPANSGQAREQNPLEKRTGVESASGKKQEISPEQLAEAVKIANEVMQVMDRQLQFSVHEGTNRPMVKVVDPNTDKVIREIPPEKILDMVAKMWEVVGLFVDEKA